MDGWLGAVFTSQWWVILIVTLVMLLAAEAGFRLGRRAGPGLSDGLKGHAGTIEVAVLAMLGLLLGFGFAMAVQGFEARRQLVVQEANSIRAMFLSAGFLPDEHRAAVEDLVRRYVDARLEFGTAGSDTPRITAAEEETLRLQDSIWAHAVLAGREAPTSTVASFAAAAKETADLHGLRAAALHNHVPGTVWLLLLLVAACGVALGGYACGTHGGRLAVSQATLPVLVSLVITILADLDSPRRGMIAYSQQSMFDLKRELAAPVAGR